MRNHSVRPRATSSFSLTARSASLVLSLLAAAPALADVSLRVQGRPADAPIQAFVRVTDQNGSPVAGLTGQHFNITIDGEPVTIGAGDVTLPPEFDEDQKVSVIFAMDYSGSVTDVALEAMEQAAVDFADAMSDGDMVAIVKFNDTHPDRASVVLPFTEVVNGPGNNPAIEAAARADYPGDGTNLLDAIQVSVDHFLASTLPDGPKAIILITDGGEFHSDATQDDVIEMANAAALPVFSIGVGDIANAGNEELMLFLADETGGQYYPTADEDEIADAYATISVLLTAEYLVAISNGINDCEQHVMVVTVAGESDDATFTRRTCDSEPNPFSFATLTDRRPGTSAVSEAVTISGIEIPAHISVIQGSYSIGCTGDAFTNQPGTIEDGDELCLRHQTSDEFSTSKTTTVTVGGVAATFTTTTHADSAGSNGGGGGSAGLAMLFGLAGLLLARRRLA